MGILVDHPSGLPNSVGPQKISPSPCVLADLDPPRLSPRVLPGAATGSAGPAPVSGVVGIGPVVGMAPRAGCLGRVLFGLGERPGGVEILSPCNQGEVGGIAAESDAAQVVEVERAGGSTLDALPCRAVAWPMPAIHKEIAIAAPGRGGCPQPTSGVGLRLDLRPESLWEARVSEGEWDRIGFNHSVPPVPFGQGLHERPHLSASPILL